MANIMNTMETRDLCKSYGAVEVLKNINIAMEPGDFLVLVGPSGCGKSTLLNCIAGLEEITQGGLYIGGRDVTQVPPKDRDIAMVFQSYALYPTMTVAQNIGFGMKIRRIPKPEIAKKVAEVAELLQIGPLLDRRPSQLSGGQRQRVAMGRALVRDPKLFLFDEPLSNLDAKLRVEMRAEIKALHQQTNASIVYVTHDQIEAMTLATQIVVLKDGIVQQVGTPEEIYDHPANMFVADFMGAPPMNLLPADIQAEGSVMIGDIDLRASIPTSKQGKDLIVGIRPEHLALAGASHPDFTVTPDMIENTGSDSYVSFTLAGNTVTARVPGRISTNSGALGFIVDRNHVSLFDRTDGCRIDGQLQG